MGNSARHEDHTLLSPTQPPSAATEHSVASESAFSAGSTRPDVVSRSTVIAWLVGLVAIFLIAFSLQYEPPRGIRVPGFASPLPESCNLRRTLGIDCPGCGLTRSFVLSAKQQWSRAFQIHPFGTIGFAFLMALIPYRLWQGWQLYKGRSPRSTLVIELSVLVALAGGSMIWWIGRLISGAA